MLSIIARLRRWILCVITIIMLATNSLAYAAFISNSDIESLNIIAPSQWKVYNLTQLFDGIDSRYTSTRFAAYRDSGDYLSVNNAFTISVLLSQDHDIASLSFYNDWRNYLQQQVSTMDISLYDAHERLLWHDDFTNLQQDSWLKIELAKFNTPQLNVRKIDFNITDMQGDHIEIRELLVEATLSPKLAFKTVSNVSVTGVIVLFIGGLLVIMYRVKTSQ